MTKKRYWTQFGYSSQDALRGWDLDKNINSRTSPWSSQTKYYMENIVKNSSLFFKEGFWYGDNLHVVRQKEHKNWDEVMERVNVILENNL